MSSLPSRPNLEHLRKQAKALIRQYAAGEPDAVRRVESVRTRAWPSRSGPLTLSHADALRVVAYEYGFPSWPALKHHVVSLTESTGVEVFAIDAVTDLDDRFRRLFPGGTAALPVSEVLTTEAEAVLTAHERGDGHGVMQIRDWTDVLIGKSPEEIATTPLSRDQVFGGVAREHGYADWAAAARDGASRLLDPVFERAVDAVVTGRLDLLRAMLEERPTLCDERSAYGHRATLLHYSAANGVETRRQMTPSNARAVVKCLLDAGAHVDATCETYGGGEAQTPLCLTITSGHPAAAGVQVEMVEELLDHGAAIDGVGGGGEPLKLAVDFGYLDVAELLVARGARIGDVATAVAVGDSGAFETLMQDAPAADKEKAFLAACEFGRSAMLVALVSSGASLSTLGRHGESGLHLAALGGHVEIVQWLLDQGVDPVSRDDRWKCTPSEWAAHSGHTHVAAMIDARAANG